MIYLHFRCDICRKGFVKSRAFLKHMTKHKQNERFKCLKCGKSYKVKSCLTRHMKSHDDTNKQFIQCPKCEKR